MGHAPDFMTIDIDTGGTFTDGYVSGSGVGVQVKVDTTPHDLTHGIIACIDRAAEVLSLNRRALLAATGSIRLSTTVGTNALINRTGPSLGLLLGPELHVRPGVLEDLPVRPDLVAAAGPGDDHLAAVKRLLDRGARLIVVALDGDGGESLEAAENSLRESIALEYPRHYLGAVPVLSSHDVTRSPDPSARLRTAVINAYLHPLMSHFLYRVEDELRREGYRFPLLIGNADGGSSRVAKTTAIRTWGSGPAGAVAGAAHVARTLGIPALLTLDVGGTSSDISLLSAGRWRYTVEPVMDGARVAVPVVELESIGVGGGSIVHVVDGEVVVGPRSAGAQPGPAAFGLGGEDATLADAFCCLGVFDPAHFLGGRKKLDKDAAVEAFARIADALMVDVPTAAHAAVRAATSTVAAGIGALLDRYDVRPSDVELLTGGGAGGLLGCWVAAAAGLKATRAFPLAPVFSAYGLSTLDRMHSYEIASDLHGLCDRVDVVIGRARADMRSEGVDPEVLRSEVEIEVGDDGAARAVRLGAIRSGQDAADLISAAVEPVRLIRLRVVAATSTRPPAAASPVDEAATTRMIRWDAVEPAEADTTVRSWAALRPGERHVGPTLIESVDTTVVLPPGFTATVGDHADLYIVNPIPGA